MKTRKLVLTGLFIALGIVLPRMFHMVGGQGAGSIFLPMHLPVLIGGIFLGPIPGLAIGCISVLIGFMLGMPPMPMALFMFFELGVYGLVGGFLGYTKSLNVYISLIGAMLMGRLASLLLMKFCILALGMKLPPMFGTLAMFATGIPGVIIQIILVPVVVMTLKKYIFSGKEQESIVG